jgi:signal transduction histidine kinase/ActR/RegA family two-component response regulator
MNMAATLDFNLSGQELADMLPTGVAILNQNDESIMVNRRFRELMTCCTARSFECWSQSIHPEDYDRVATAYLETSRSKHALRIEFRTRSQISLWRVLMLAPLDDTDLDRLNLSGGGFICTIADITQEKTAELLQVEIAREAQERKQQQERFIDMISHEVRNPLSAILHCTEDIEAVKDKENCGAPVADIAQAAETISLCVAHQKKIVDDVLIFSKLDASMLTLSPRRVQPKRHLARTLSMFRPQLRKQDIQIEYKLDTSYADCGVDWVLADLDRMGQVLINLVSNAIKFTAKADSKREIRVSIGASTKRPSSYPPNVVFFESDENALHLDATTTSEWGNSPVAYVMVAVKDTGIGISDQAQKRLFERFNQATPRTESVYGGSGLGLNVSRKLCHLHGGEIGASSMEGEGSTFSFFFKVRRDVEPYSLDPPNYDESEIEQLCGGIQAMSNKVTRVKSRTKSPEIHENPIITHIPEISPEAASDDKYTHTLELARQAQPDEPSASERQILQPDLDESTKSPGASEPIGVKSDTKENRNVLVVEDNIINRQIVSRKLQSLGYHVSEATNGQEALDAVQHDKFDCILMDQEMPIMDGKSATMAIRNLGRDSTANTPILGVTANMRATQQRELLDAGMNDIIHKPYRTNDLFEKINQLIILRSKK